jgi:hypothetical protein
MGVVEGLNFSESLKESLKGLRGIPVEDTGKSVT